MLKPITLDMLTEELRLQAEKYLEPFELREHEYLYKAGDQADRGYLVDQGELRLEVDTEELDAERVLEIAPEGVFIGEGGLLGIELHAVNAIAGTDVRGRSLSRDAMLRMESDDPVLAARIYQGLGKAATAKLMAAVSHITEYRFAHHGHTAEIDVMVHNARKAQQAFVGWSEKRVDDLLYALCEPIIANAVALAEDAVAETHMGNVRDKTLKHVNAALGVYEHIVGKTGSGAMPKGASSGVIEVADAMGVLFGLIPATNPVSTTCFKALISVKSRNAIILSPNRIGSKVVVKTVDMMREVLCAHSAPEDLIQVVRERQSRQTTAMFMHHKGVDLVLATGGASMVRAAYSSGTPAIGVGPGNAPCVIASDADVDHAADSIVKSKSFDNGVICGAEHNLVCVARNYDALVASLERHGAAVLSPDETALFMAKGASTGVLGRRIVAQDPEAIAEYVGISRPYTIRLIVIPVTEINEHDPMSREKTAPVLSLFCASDDEQAITMSEQILAIDGTGHTAMIHTASKNLARTFAARMHASRILVNSPGTQGIMGACTGLTPSFTLGCGTYGGTSTTDNVSFQHLVNIKRIAWYLPHKKTAEIVMRLQSSASYLLRIVRFIGAWRRFVAGVK
ncbi:MAG: aldehyde dehydrogenase family protein [Ignavibacteria bacterium]|nr:aldehyde dehydrogenase family protein [Ignavibacteria bacterium]